MSWNARNKFNNMVRLSSWQPKLKEQPSPNGLSICTEKATAPLYEKCLGKEVRPKKVVDKITNCVVDQVRSLKGL